LFLSPLVLKAISVDNYIFQFCGVKLFGAMQVLSNDAIIYFIIFLLFYLSLLDKTPNIASVIIRIVAIIVLSLYIIDYYVITNFYTHFVISDAIKYASYAPKYIKQIYEKGFIVFFIPLALVSVTVLIIFTKYKIKNKIIHWFFIVILLFFLLISSFTSNENYVHAWMYRNFFDYNLMILSESKDYSDEFIDNFVFDDKMFYSSKIPETPNIIILLVESLSSYQSLFFSGIKNWTPNLDEIASENISYKNFYANGYTSECAFLSLLTGHYPIYPPPDLSHGRRVPFYGFYDIEDSLPNILNRQGYSTEYLANSDVDFLNIGNWAKSIGFTYIEGSEHPYYRKFDKFSFGAAPDKALFDRVLERVKFNKNNNYFLFVKTTSSHPPFIDPESKIKSEALVFKYVDKQIGIFYKKLEKLDFFKKGILVIVGDHHAMVPLKKKEIDSFGPLKVVAQIPMIVSYGGKKKSVVYEQYQQVDVFNSIKCLISNTQLYSDWLGDVFSYGKKAAKYILFRRGDSRNLISVFSGDKDFLIKLDGDNTHMRGNHSLDKVKRDLIVKKINYLRIIQNNKAHLSKKH
jgi:lipoteichoic acid synthase